MITIILSQEGWGNSDIWLDKPFTLLHTALQSSSHNSEAILTRVIGNKVFFRCAPTWPALFLKSCKGMVVIRLKSALIWGRQRKRYPIQNNWLVTCLTQLPYVPPLTPLCHRPLVLQLDSVIWETWNIHVDHHHTNIQHTNAPTYAALPNPQLYTVCAKWIKTPAWSPPLFIENHIWHLFCKRSTVHFRARATVKSTLKKLA